MAPEVGASRRRARRALRIAGWLFLACGMVAVITGAVLFTLAYRQEAQLTQEWSRTISQAHAIAPAPSSTNQQAAVVAPAPSKPIAFAVRVPRLGYYAAVGEGVGSAQLFAGPAHYPTTAMPGQGGNIGIAAHNTYWLQFGQLQPGDLVILETRGGSFDYRVSGSRVVSPQDSSVLAPTAGERLTLTTCWPLWAGPFAQQRLVIFATPGPRPANVAISHGAAPATS